MFAEEEQLRARRGAQIDRGTANELPPNQEGGRDRPAVPKLPFHRDQLGFIHWMLVFLMVAAVYASVVWQDQRMPEVKPADQYTEFSEIRARQMLNQITRLGPRPSGSEALEVFAFKIITEKINSLKNVVNEKKFNRLELDVQHPTGCFDLKFLSIFTLCYHKVTNIVARIGPKQGPTDFSILINCHFDTLPDTPGATDDAVSCAIMMEIMEVLSHSEKPLEHDILFLFNGAEENFLQASHGFITEHPWRHSIRAFINLEGCGSGGRELLFQTGPGESWLIKTYLDNAPHPHCSVMGQEIFQLGVIPSDTDFRVFRDYGRISGFDIAYVQNGWVYHTEFDRPELIESGAIQRSGDNVLAVSKALIRSPYLKQPAKFDEGTKWVFFDVVGLFTVFYEMKLAILFNYTTLAFVLLHLYKRINAGQGYTFGVLVNAFVRQFFAFSVMFLVGLGMVFLVGLLNMTMAWYAMPELVFPLYIMPMLCAAFWAHNTMKHQIRMEATIYALKKTETNSTIDAQTIEQAQFDSTIRAVEKAQYDSTIVIWSIILLILTWLGAASSFFFLLHVFFPLLRDPVIRALEVLSLIKERTSRVLFWVQFCALIPLIVIINSYTQLLFDFFVPVMGRFGNAINPEFVMMPFSLLVSSTFIMFTNNLIYLSRRLNFMIKCMVAISAFGFLVITTTNVGVPFKYSEESPRLRRIIALHAKRSIYNFDGSFRSTDTGLFVQALDYRGADDLPEHTFLQGAGKPDCSNTTDEYCQLPYYTAIHELFPPDRSRWVPLPAEPPIAKPLGVKLLERKFTDGNKLNLTFSIRGGSDKMSLHVTPINGFQLQQWVFTPFNPTNYGARPRSTYFVFLTYGHEAPEERVVWILLENKQKERMDPIEVEKMPALELAVATHYAHGKNQNSDTLLQLRSLISKRRLTPHAGVGFWRWGITMIGGISEIVIHFF